MAPIDARRKLEQIRKNKNKTNKDAKVKDLRQVIARKGGSKSNDRTPNNKTVSGRVNKDRSSSNGRVRDLREVASKSRPAAPRRTISQQIDNRHPIKTKIDRPNTRLSSSTSHRRLSSRSAELPQQQYYVPPHLQHQHPTYIIAAPPLAPAAAPSTVPQSHLAMDSQPESQGASVLVSNLIPTITQSEIIGLFADIGDMSAVNMVNQTTALVTYRNSADAVRAVKVYHNRLLDGKPMLVNMMPSSSPATSIRSRIGNHVPSSHPAPMEISYSSRRY